MITPDKLTNFLYWFLNEPIGILKSPEADRSLTVHESVLTLTIFHQPPFQVELVVLLPDAPPWPGEHRHPNVDSYEVAWYNTVNFIKNGQTLNGPELIVPVKVTPEIFCMAGCVRLLPSDWHGTPALPKGGALISVQHWLNGVTPTSVGNDWEGAAVTPGHQKLLEARGNSAAAVDKKIVPSRK